MAIAPPSGGLGPISSIPESHRSRLSDGPSSHTHRVAEPSGSGPATGCAETSTRRHRGPLAPPRSTGWSIDTPLVLFRLI